MNVSIFPNAAGASAGGPGPSAPAPAAPSGTAQEEEAGGGGAAAVVAEDVKIFEGNIAHNRSQLASIVEKINDSMDDIRYELAELVAEEPN